MKHIDKRTVKWRSAAMRKIVPGILWILAWGVVPSAPADNDIIFSLSERQVSENVDILTEEEQKWKQLEEIARNSTYTAAQKQSMYEKACGVEKLLRTPQELIDCAASDQAWNDAIFFRHYAKALHEDMDSFAEEYIRSGMYRKNASANQKNQDISQCHQLADELVQRAYAAYLASLEWFNKDMAATGHTDLALPQLQFRVALRNRLLKDLFLMSLNEGNHWVSGIRQNHEQGNCLGCVYETPFESALRKRGWGSTPLTVDQWLSNEETPSLLHRYREFIIRCIYKVEDDSPTATESRPQEFTGMAGLFNNLMTKLAPPPAGPIPHQTSLPPEVILFNRAEQCWDAYADAICRIQLPLESFSFSGSGVPEWEEDFRNAMEGSQEDYLLYLMEFANDGQFSAEQLIDFTQYELTEEAAEALSKLPG